MELLVMGDDFSATAPLTEAKAEHLLAFYRCPGCLIEPYRNRLGNVVVSHVPYMACDPGDGLGA